MELAQAGLSDRSSAAAQELHVQTCGLEDVFSRSLVVSNHLANNAQTRGMLGYPLFRLLRPQATFINTGRGAQVVEPELVRILMENGKGGHSFRFSRGNPIFRF